MDEALKKRAGTVFEYHERTKHSPERYARSLGFMDWENQPLPFRFFEGAERIGFVPEKGGEGLPADILYRGREGKPLGITLETVGRFLELSLGLSAWKEQGNARWVLRVNPSSGNLHPTECYLVLPLPGRGAPMLAHYNPFLHCLEVLGEYSGVETGGVGPENGFLLMLTSIHWREAWKYGERAYRYCSLDTGHALAALRFSANLSGWHMRLSTDLGFDGMDRLFGSSFSAVDPLEMEFADGLCLIGNAPGEPGWYEALLAGGILAHSGARPNRLSREHYDWKIIHGVATAARTVSHDGNSSPGVPPHCREAGEKGVDVEGAVDTEGDADGAAVAEALILNRRSAVAFDRERSVMEMEDFSRLLKRLMPENGAPFDLFPYAPSVNPILFVHNVKSLAHGVYILVREPGALEELREALDPGFSWEAALPDLPLMLLKQGDYRSFARNLSCVQEIASESAFAAGMLTRFESRIAAAPFYYPRLFWECGMIGQVLYLEAERAGLRGTGIGCFFDDMLHDLLGISGREFRLLYNFTVGFPVEDPRLKTGRPWAHLEKQAE